MMMMMMMMIMNVLGCTGAGLMLWVSGLNKIMNTYAISLYIESLYNMLCKFSLLLYVF
jgi:hypothetical protein